MSLILMIMYTYTFGGKKGKKHILHESSDLVVVRTKKSKDLIKEPFKSEREKALKDFTLEMEFPEANIAVYKTKPSVKTGY